MGAWQGLAGLVVGVGGFGYNATETVSALMRLGKSKVEAQAISKELRLKAQASNFTCSFEDIRANLAAERTKLLENEFNGSGWRALQDRLTLGSLSKRVTAKLYMISSLEKDVAKAELEELKQLRLPSTNSQSQSASSAGSR